MHYELTSKVLYSNCILAPLLLCPHLYKVEKKVILEN